MVLYHFYKHHNLNLPVLCFFTKRNYINVRHWNTPYGHLFSGEKSTPEKPSGMLDFLIGHG